MEVITAGQLGLVLTIISLVGVIFSVYKSYRNPQIETDKKASELKADVDKKAELLEERAKWDREQTAKNFTEIQNNVKEAFLLAANHTNTVDTKVNKLIEKVDSMHTTMTAGLAEIHTTLKLKLPK